VLSLGSPAERLTAPWRVRASRPGPGACHSPRRRRATPSQICNRAPIPPPQAMAPGPQTFPGVAAVPYPVLAPSARRGPPAPSPSPRNHPLDRAAAAAAAAAASPPPPVWRGRGSGRAREGAGGRAGAAPGWPWAGRARGGGWARRCAALGRRRGPGPGGECHGKTWGAHAPGRAAAGRAGGGGAAGPGVPRNASSHRKYHAGPAMMARREGPEARPASPSTGAGHCHPSPNAPARQRPSPSLRGSFPTATGARGVVRDQKVRSGAGSRNEACAIPRGEL
jgi:hypothetical protein